MSENFWLHHSLVTDVPSRLVQDIPKDLPARPTGSSKGLPGSPTSLGISFVSSLRYSIHRNQFLYFLFLSRPKVSGLFVFMGFLTFDPLGADPCIDNTGWLASPGLLKFRTPFFPASRASGFHFSFKLSYKMGRGEGGREGSKLG